MKRNAGWSSLLADSTSHHEGVLDVARRLVSGPPLTRGHIALAGVDAAVSALVALRGAAVCMNFFPELQPLVDRIGRKLALFPDSVDPLSMMTFFSVIAASETVGAPLKSPDFDVEAKLDELITFREKSSNDKVTMALLALGSGHANDARLLFGEGEAASAGAADKTVVSLVVTLASALESRAGANEVGPIWDAYLRGFPQALEASSAEWQHLLLAARIVMGKLGGTPVGEVAETLHRRIKEIAAGESA